MVANSVAGITPAYAGNMLTSEIAPSRIKDHPRLRGEHALENGRIAGDEGSPPPTRGT